MSAQEQLPAQDSRNMHAPCDASLASQQQQQPTLTRKDASLTLVPNPNAGSEGEVDLHWEPKPDLNIFVLPSGILLPLSILEAF
jgi:hypothetical protein